MKSAVLVANIGVRDLCKKDGSYPFVSGDSSPQKSVYFQSKQLCESGKYDDLQLSFLKPVIDLIKSEFNLIEILLFGTKQEVEDDQDTAYITYIVKDVICNTCSFNEDKVKIEVITKNPTEYNDLMRFYRDKLGTITDEVDKVFVSVTGGTPQQNSTIMIESLSKFGEKSLMIYMQEGKSIAIKCDIGSYVRNQLKNPSTESSIPYFSSSGRVNESESAVLIASLGVRDLGKKGTNKPLFSIPEINIFEESEKILKNEEFEDLELILLDPAIKKIRDLFNLAKVILFGTKQDLPHQKDTINIANISKEILSKSYKLDEECIEIIEVSKNPSDYEAMLVTYHKEFEKIPSNFAQIFVSITGGTSQQKFAMMFESMFKFREKTRFLYKSKNDETVREYGVYPSFAIPTTDKFGHQSADKGSTDEAIQLYNQTLQGIESELDKYPERWDYISRIGLINAEIGHLLTTSGSVEDAKQLFESALEKHELLLKKEPENKHYQSLVIEDVLNVIQSYFDCVENIENPDNYITKMELYKKILEICEKYLDPSFIGMFEDKRKNLIEKKNISTKNLHSINIELREKQIFERKKQVDEGKELIIEANKSNSPDISLIKKAVEIFENVMNEEEEAKKYYLVYSTFLKFEDLLSEFRPYSLKQIDEKQKEILYFIDELQKNVDKKISALFKQMLDLINSRTEEIFIQTRRELDELIYDVENYDLRMLLRKFVKEQLYKTLGEPLNFVLSNEGWNLVVEIENFDESSKNSSGKLIVKAEGNIIFRRKVFKSKIMIDHYPQEKNEKITILPSYGREVHKKSEFTETITKTTEVCISKKDCKHKIFISYPESRIAIVQLKYEIIEQNRIIELTNDLNKYRTKISLILQYLSSYEIDFVVFPEFSMPFELIKDIQKFSDETGITVIAGTHYVTKSNLNLYTELFDREFTDDDLFKNICPIVIPDSKILHVEKILPAMNERPLASEEGMTQGNSLLIFELKKITFGILICYECLNDKLRELLLESCNFIFVPQTNPNTVRFYDKLMEDINNPSHGNIIYFVVNGIFPDEKGEIFGGCSGAALTLNKFQNEKTNAKPFKPADDIKEQCVMIFTVDMEFNSARDNQQAQNAIKTQLIPLFEEKEILNHAEKISHNQRSNQYERFRATEFWELVKEIKKLSVAGKAAIIACKNADIACKADEIKNLLGKNGELIADYSELLYQKFNNLKTSKNNKGTLEAVDFILIPDE